MTITSAVILKQDQPTLYRSRFYIALIVFLVSIVNNSAWSSFSSITPTASVYFETSHYAVNMLSLTFSIVYLAFGPIAAFILNSYGLRPTLLLGAWTTCLGTLVTWLAGYSKSKYVYALVGQSIAAIGQPFLLGSPSFVSAHWFGEHERMTANTAMVLGSPLGAAVIIAIAPSIASGAPDQVQNISFYIAMMALATALLSLGVKNLPPSPPSHSAEKEIESFTQGFKDVWSRSYLILFFVSGWLVAAFNTFITFLSDYVVANNYTEDQSGLLGIITFASGLFAAAVLSVILDRYDYHRSVLSVSSLLCVVGTVLFYFGNTPDQFTLLAAGAALIGFGGFPAIPLTLELAVEATFPVNEGLSGGLMMWCGQLWSLLSVFVTNAIRQDGILPQSAVLFLVGMTCIAALLTLFFRNDKLRSKCDLVSQEL